MYRLTSVALAALLSVSLGAAAQNAPVLIYGIMELSGTGMTPGTNSTTG